MEEWIRCHATGVMETPRPLLPVDPATANSISQADRSGAVLFSLRSSRLRLQTEMPCARYDQLVKCGLVGISLRGSRLRLQTEMPCARYDQLVKWALLKMMMHRIQRSSGIRFKVGQLFELVRLC